MNSPYELADALANRSWLRFSRPFPHVVAQSVFKPDYYRVLSSAFKKLLGTRVEEGVNRTRLSRNMTGYDAYGMTFPPEYQGPFSLFMSRPWHDALGRLFDAKCTGHVNCGVHHHAAGSANGWIHNDLNPGYFVDYPSDDGINVVRHNLCNYCYGNVSRNGISARRVIRRIAMLYYLCNPQWQLCDGGVTGLYACKDDTVERPRASVPPINNSLLAFECTPFSYHSFISNRRNSRNCVIMWLHSSPEEISSRWGQKSIVEWPQRNP